MPTHNFQVLRDRLDREQPESRMLRPLLRRAGYDALALARLRDAHGHGLPELPVETPEGSIPAHADPYLSALAEQVAAVGGRLELRAVVPEEAVTIWPDGV